MCYGSSFHSKQIVNLCGKGLSQTYGGRKLLEGIFY